MSLGAGLIGGLLGLGSGGIGSSGMTVYLRSSGGE